MTEPYYSADMVTVYHGDCLEVMSGLADSSVDAVVTDPPYALEFMGKGWDRFTPLEFEQWCAVWAAECLRVLKPGGHMLAFGGSRTWHRLAAGIEDAGFEIRDSIAWLYGSGFPKSLDVSKAIDKAAGAERTEGGREWQGGARTSGIMGAINGEAGPTSTRTIYDLPVTPEAAAWQGWGTALKPAFEPIVVARKPLAKGRTVAANVLQYGTGALNIDAARVAASGRPLREVAAMRDDVSYSGTSLAGRVDGSLQSSKAVGLTDFGRWPANLVLDESQAAELDRQAPDAGGAGRASGPTLREPTDASVAHGARRGLPADREPAFYGDSGGASRFFPTFRYEPKAPTVERPRDGQTAHPTVKPLDLMRWLVRLVTPPGGTVLEPFAGSGTTLEAALLEGFAVIGIEREADYLPLIRQRLSKPLQQSLFSELDGAE